MKAVEELQEQNSNSSGFQDSNGAKSKVQFLFVGNKAGMGDVNKERVASVVEEASKDSEYFKRQQEKREKYSLKIQEMREIIAQTKEDNYRYEQLVEEVKENVAEVEKSRLLNRVWAHFDIDMFFVACEMRDRPELATKPCAVGKHTPLSARAPARKRILSAIPFFQQRNRPELPYSITTPCMRYPGMSIISILSAVDISEYSSLLVLIRMAYS